MRIALILEYDGTNFCGWQTQPSGCAVQDALDRALTQIAAHPIETQCAGRTDAGVHALGQVVHFDTTASRPLSAWVRGVNTLLPRSIAVRSARVVADSFHARYRATARRYSYLLLNRPERPGLFHNYVGWHHRKLDGDAMRNASRQLIGTHDFSAFRAAECQARTPVKTMQKIEIEHHGDMFVFHFVADAFLHHMVRNIVGCLVKVGTGSRPEEWIRDVLDGRQRERGAPTFAASGLYLTGVEYDPHWGVPAPTSAAPVLLQHIAALSVP
ncbi:MAG TPA: tRNA pseudouridine(38-40) synthase TruA [Burkholderiales bacterium]|nr:tRNA pseudouridine(38-40) synthase TruA [Burkholderiales bacterium]